MITVEMGLEETGEMNVASFLLEALIGNTTEVEWGATKVRLYANADDYIELRGTFDLDVKSSNPLDKVVKITSYTAVVDGEVSYKMSGVKVTPEELSSFDALSDYLNRQQYTMIGNDGANALTSGDKADFLDGGKGDDKLYALGGTDELNGGAGKDLMVGGDGSDTYYIDNAADRIVETTRGGTFDIAYATVSFSMKNAANVEVIELTGSKNVNLTGNDDDNTLFGNSGDNKLDGGKGDDHLVGGAGDDTYLVDSKKDEVIEEKKGGTDAISATFSIDLSKYANIEDVILLGKGNISAYGNSANNFIAGNAGANTLGGGKGADTLEGNGGADLFHFVKGDGRDTILDFVASGKGQDHIDLDDYGSNLKFKNLDIEKLGKHDVDIDFGHGDHLVLKDVNIKDIDASDFLF
jgi:Ca2+-binding RTX toxin-like protein